MNELMIFKGYKVEVFEWNGLILFNPYDVGNCLDLTESAVRMSISNMNQNQVIKLTNSKVNSNDFRKLHNTGDLFKLVSEATGTAELLNIKLNKSLQNETIRK